MANMTSSQNNLDPDYESLSNRLKLLAHPERLRILDAIRRDAGVRLPPGGAAGQAAAVCVAAAALLRDAGLIEDRKQGQNVYYGLIDDEVRAWLDAMLGPVEGELLSYGAAQACDCLPMSQMQ